MYADIEVPSASGGSLEFQNVGQEMSMHYNTLKRPKNSILCDFSWTNLYFLIIFFGVVNNVKDFIRI